MEKAKEDLREILGVAEMLARHTNQFEERMTQRMEKLEITVKEMKKERAIPHKKPL